ncbi:MAG: addiction module protein [Balneolaceae bacterium]|nr:addiction module protein [Balneolaceae bacterium]
MKTKELIEEIASLPVEDRVLVADSVLRSLNPPEAEIDKKWAKEAKKRLEELRSGTTKAIPGDEVFEKINNRFSE